MAPLWIIRNDILNPLITHLEYRNVLSFDKDTGDPKHGPLLGVIWTIDPDPDPEKEIWQAGIGSSVCPGLHTQGNACKLVEAARRASLRKKKKR